MHELGIVFHIIDSIEEVGRQNKLRRVSTVTLELGEVSGVVHTYLEDCWHWAAARSQLLNGSRLAIEALPAVTLCEDCGSTYATCFSTEILFSLTKACWSRQFSS